MAAVAVIESLLSTSDLNRVQLRNLPQTAPSLPESLIATARNTVREAFDPEKHLAFQPPEKIYTMEELGFGDVGISPNAVSTPFPLFSEQAVEQMRAEVFSKPVLDSCQVSSSQASNMIRGHCPKLAPFIYNAWNSPELLRYISSVAGVDLVPACDYDTGHCNISIKPDGAIEVLSKDGEDKPAFAWHADSYPFVCVTMLSDCVGMEGGETVLHTPKGELKARGPTMGTAVIMQGRYIEHAALQARGGRERIAMVTSLRPRSPLAKDETVLDGVRKISHLPTLYSQYTEYRLENLEEKIRNQLQTLRKQRSAGREIDTANVRAWLNEQKGFLEAMLTELY